MSKINPRFKPVLRQRPDTPGRVLPYLGIAAILLLAFLAYEIGQIRGGHNRLDAIGDKRALKRELAAAEQENAVLRERVALLETAEKIDREAYRQVEQEIQQLQQQVLQQEEDLDFYRGIVSPVDRRPGLRIQDFRVERLADMDRSFQLQLLLAQALRNDRTVKGHVELKVAGIRNGKPYMMQLSDLTNNDRSSDRLAFSFRYFQDLEADITLPADFKPGRVIVRVLPAGSGGGKIEQEYEWSAVAG